MARKKEEVNPYSSINVDDAYYKTLLIKKYENRKKWAKVDNSIIKAIIPGTISKIFINVGDEVKAGQKLLILEAMKMYNQILSPADGKISAIHVSEGNRVTKDQVLLEIDCAENVIDDN